MSDESKASRYREAGVDLDAAEETVSRYRRLVGSTHRPGVMGAVGGFGGLFSLKDAGANLNDPVLVSGTDGVGTKLKIAFELDAHDSIGVDCVAMCVNDIVTTGAEPLFFLDYLATGKLEPQQAEAIVAGVARGCRESGCALIGGETAEMPGFYPSGEYDVAGFCVGIVERSAMLGSERIQGDEVVIGVASTGFHSNGYSLVRKIVSDRGLDLRTRYDALDGRTLGEALLEPTRLYAGALKALMHEVDLRASAHITGGGFHENLPRVLPDGVGAVLRSSSWRVPPVITFIMEAGDVSLDEGYHVFNMGIGLVLALPESDASDALSRLADAGYDAAIIGHLEAGAGVSIL